MDVPEVLIVVGVLALFAELAYNWKRNHSAAPKAHR